MQKAFSLVELLVAVAIMFIMFGGITLKASNMKHNANQYADRVRFVIGKKIVLADKRRTNFMIQFENVNEKLNKFNFLWAAKSRTFDTDYTASDDMTPTTIDSIEYYPEKTPFEMPSSCSIETPQNNLIYKPVGEGFTNLNEETLKLIVTDSKGGRHGIVLNRDSAMTKTASVD